MVLKRMYITTFRVRKKRGEGKCLFKKLEMVMLGRSIGTANVGRIYR
jgi:hypothetical protein